MQEPSHRMMGTALFFIDVTDAADVIDVDIRNIIHIRYYTRITSFTPFTVFIFLTRAVSWRLSETPTTRNPWNIPS